MALIQASLFASVLVALLGSTWWSVSDYAEAQLRAEVKTEMASLLQAASDGTLREQINQRVAVMPIGPEYYLLTDASGQRLAGNLSYRPTRVGWHTVALQGALGEDNSDADSVHLYAAHLADGRWVVAGSDNRTVVELSELMSSRFLEIGIPAIVLVLLIGGFGGLLYLRRIDRLGAMAERALEEQSTMVIADPGKGDEFDRLATRLNQMLSRMRVLMDGMRQVSNDIAHDLRTPLTRMRQRMEVCLERHDDEVHLREGMQQSIIDIDHLLAVFRALLRIASVESRHRRAGFGAVALSSVFESIAETYRPVAEDLGQHFDAMIQPGLCVLGDLALLTQVMANLIENALHHTPTGSRVQLDLFATPDGIVGRVSDSGPGIPVEARDHVLRRFVRLDSSRATPGSGLGLALVAAVADLHGIRLVLGDGAPGLVVELAFPASELAPPAHIYDLRHCAVRPSVI
ncbi:sensor histidine kinase [Dyella sp. Tek66A03]|uniref:sensor histidine kinase n=1 Tax=Dyella sp. Tek66A03 TaxID=3458298 RepID=UPI00403EBA0A